MTQRTDAPDEDRRVAATLDSVNALSQLLALNSVIEQARAEIDTPFQVTANRVTERANPIGRHRLRSVGAPVAKAVELGRARAALIAGTGAIDKAVAAEGFAAEGLGR